MNRTWIRWSAWSALIALAALSRLLPHPPNFTPIGAMALFSGAHMGLRPGAFAVPLLALLVSDLLIGTHPLMPFVYGSFALITVLGYVLLHTRRTLWRLGGSALLASTLFYLITNFGVWAVGSWYPKTPEGLLSCYIAAIPFFGNTLAGDLFFTAVLFGLWAWLERRVPALETA
jgi:hypothetical protein|nr:MAG: hypothetical protein KatS3mg041_1485 [Bacteroidota bacterium]